MKALLTAVQSRLMGQLTGMRKVAIVPDPNWVLEDVAHPYVTLADRGLVRDYQKGTRIETLTVRVTVYQEILRDEASLLGSGSNKGVLDLLDDVQTALWSYLPDDYYDVRMGTQLPAEVVVSDAQFSARKSIDVAYRREVIGE